MLGWPPRHPKISGSCSIRLAEKRQLAAMDHGHHDLPSGKRLHSYGKSPFSMGKSTINGHFQ
jgi:hypothetical protein